MKHFLHIGKTGGTALGHAIRDCGAPADLRLHGHRVGLGDIPEGEQAFFFVRHPVSRFASGFSSRFRKGLPANDIAWKSEEIEAFGWFQTPDALGQALSSADNGLREAALAAMGGIRHVRSSLYDWLVSDEYFDSRRDDIAFIGTTETLEADFEILKRLELIPEAAVLPRDDARAHRTPIGFDNRLGALARRNLEDWYAADMALHRRCLAIKRERWPELGGS